jgi:hypothetical protein
MWQATQTINKIICYIAGFNRAYILGWHGIAIVCIKGINSIPQGDSIFDSNVLFEIGFFLRNCLEG